MDLLLGTRAQLFLEDLNGPLSITELDELEDLILGLNKAASDGEEAVSDAVYDALVDILRSSFPESVVLNQLWEGTPGKKESTEYGALLSSHPMMSIRTIKVEEELEDFDALVPEGTELFASYKINGHGVRVVYLDGNLVSATSRARASEGRDLTRQMINLLGSHNESLEGYSGLVEVRGEVALREDRMSAAREFNPNLKSAFSAVSSLIKPSSSPEENLLLDFLAYRAIFESGKTFTSKEEEYSWLKETGFDTPAGAVSDNEGGVYQTAHELLEAFAADEYPYFCDGIVVEVNSREEFNMLDEDGKYHQGNIALKMGKWAQDLYPGKVCAVIWTKGKKKLSPVVIVRDPEFPVELLNAEQLAFLKKGVLRGIMQRSDGQYQTILEGDVVPGSAIPTGVLTAQGNRVSRVPVYEPRNLLLLEAYPERFINFRYGGEAGVVPADAKGRGLEEAAAEELIKKL